MYFFRKKFLNKKSITLFMNTQHKSDSMSFEERINELCKSLDCSGKQLTDELTAFEKKVSSQINYYNK